MERQTTREINVKDMFFRIMKKWRSILAVALALGLALGAYSMLKELKAGTDAETAKANEQYRIALNEYEASRRALETQIERARSAAEEIKDYYDHSAFMKIDPMNVWTGTISLYIDPDNHEVSSQGSTNAERAGAIAAAYDAYLTGGEFFNEIAQKSSLVDEAGDLAELVTVETGEQSSALRITCIGGSEAFVQEIMTLVRQELENKYQVFRKELGEHSLVIPVSSCFSLADEEVFEEQQEKLEFINTYKESAQEAEKELQKLKEPKNTSSSGTSLFVKQTVKGILIGLIGGVLLMGCLYGLRYVLSNTMKSETDWKAMGIPVLSYIRAEEKRKSGGKIDAWIERHLRVGGALLDTEEGIGLAAGNLSAVLRGQGMDSCVLLSDIAEETAEALVDKLNGAELGIRYSLANNILSNPAAASRLEESGDVLLLCRSEETTIDTVRRELTFLQACGRKAIGAIVLE